MARDSYWLYDGPAPENKTIVIIFFQRRMHHMNNGEEGSVGVSWNGYCLTFDFIVLANYAVAKFWRLRWPCGCSSPNLMMMQQMGETCTKEHCDTDIVAIVSCFY